MGIEIERKFLVLDDSWKKEVIRRISIRQGYVQCENHATVRVRIADHEAYLTIKSPRGISGLTRTEFNYPIPAEDADVLLKSVCSQGLVEKFRNIVPAGNGLIWEIDEFAGANTGLVMAELELPSPDTPFERPSWLGKEVTDDYRYYNSNLVAHPYTDWEKEV